MLKQIKEEYDILKELGAGGMATVYKAIQKSLTRPVAIKELKKVFHADEQIVRRFEREAKLAASFQNENIVHIYDYWASPHHCIVMEYVDGTNLADILEKTGPLPVDVGIMMSLQVCNALDYTHMRGLVHRDIKPGNIMVKRNGEVKLMDFGIAHMRAMDSLTQPGTFLGTPAYMSPEQILGQTLDARSDVFSFGIVLYEMFTGRKPFVDEETRSVSAKILNDGFVAPRRLNNEIPRSVQRIIKKCLRKKPHRRFDSMQELAQSLGKRLAGTTNKAASLKRISDNFVSASVFEAPPESETVVLTKIPGLGRFVKILIAAAAAIVLLVAASGYYFWRKGHRPAGIPLPAPTTTAPVSPAGTQPAPPRSVPISPAPQQRTQSVAPAQTVAPKKDVTQPKKTATKKKKTKKTTVR
jgi:serine/threonine protein kinase